MPDWPTGTVTFRFSDVEGSTCLWEQQPEAMQEALARHDAVLNEGTQRHRGDLQEAEHLFQLLHPALPAAFPPLHSLAAFAHHLPVQLTRFIGREPEHTRGPAGARRAAPASPLLRRPGAAAGSF